MAPRSLYRPLDSFALRAPLLPATRGLPSPAEAVKDPLVRAAIAVASPALLAELGRSPHDARGTAALLRYLIRMSTRPTPFGLFAGIGLGVWGPATDLAIGNGPRAVRVRPDMGWLTGTALELERAARPRLHLVRNPAAFVRDGRVYLSDRPGRPDVSLRATPVVLRVLARARTPVAYAELVRTSGGAPAKVARLVEQLCAHDVLLSGLRPPLTADPVTHIVATLRGALGPLARVKEGAMRTPALTREGEGSAAMSALAREGADSVVMSALARLEAIAEESLALTSTTGVTEETLAGLRARITDVREHDRPVQVDSGLPLAGRTLARSVAADAARATDLLLRLHPAPGGPRHLAGYRAAFLSRYGGHRQVPLLELLDPRFGLGPPDTSRAHQGGSAHAHQGGPAQQRSDKLLDLATTALRDGSREIVLGEDDLADLTTWTPRPDRVPVSLELSAFLAAPSREAVDRGDYTLAVGPNLGAQAAGRGLGRFAGLLGEDVADLLRGITAAEEARLGTVSAELVYLPARHRSGNVAIRPSFRAYEIPVGVTPGVPPERVIPLDELTVFVRDGRMRLWWAAGGVEVSVFAGHMLNPAGAPAVCRFLHEIGMDGVTPLAPFDWGPAASLPALPRVRSGRIVLRLAQWRRPRERLAATLRADDRAAFDRALKEWRDRWLVPRQVYLSAGDNRLLLDLDQPEQADLLREELRRGRTREITLHEALPSPGDAWLPGPGGAYISELVIPMIRSAPEPAVPPGSLLTARVPAATLPAAPELACRTRPPGSDWLYLTLYGPRPGQDALITGPLLELCRDLLAAGHADRWFFLRYADPAPHLRLRLHGDPATLLNSALPAAMTWAAQRIAEGSLSRTGLEVYEREVERYGGAEAIDLAESAFAADSACVAALLALPGTPDRIDLAVLGVDHLLAGLGMSEETRLSWYGEAAPPPRESGPAYRQRSGRLRELLGRRSPQAVREILDRRAAALQPVSTGLARLEAAGRTTMSVSMIARSLVHLHCNRLGLDQATERVVLGLLRRTRTSLIAAPLTP